VKLSPTKVQLWLDCPRKFWFEHIAGFKQPPSAAMLLGTRVHSAVETYIQTGSFGHSPAPEDDTWLAHQIAKAGEEPLKRLHAEYAAGNLDIEHAISATMAGLPFSGRIDVRRRNPPGIVDHKTTSDLDAYWHLDEAGMSRNLQLLLYAAHSFQGVEEVDIGHIYYLTKPPFGVRELHVKVSGKALDDALERTSGYIERIAKLEGVTETRDVPFRRETCRKFGGCPHASRCPNSPANEEAQKEQQTAALQTRLSTLKLPPSKRTAPMGLFTKKNAATPAAPTVAPGQISPPDAPIAMPSGATAARDAVFAAFKPSTNIMVAVLSAVIAGAVGYEDVQPIVNWGCAEKWWSISGMSAVLADFNAVQATKTAATTPEPPKSEAPKPSGLLGKPAMTEEEKTEKASLVAALEKAYHELGASKLDPIAQKLGIKQFRKAGLENLRTFVKTVGEQYPPKPAASAPEPTKTTDDGGVAISDAKTFAWALYGLSDPPPDRIGEDDIMAGFVDLERNEPDGRVEAAINEGVKLGLWAIEDDGIAVDWVKTRDVLGVVPSGPVTKTDPPTNAATSGVPARAGVVFVGCLPVDGGVTVLESWLLPLILEIEARAETDIHLIEYNDGPKQLGSLLKVALRTGRLVVPDALFVPLMHPWEPVITSVLAGHGAYVVRSVR
jgi:hypothetical protein